MRRITLHALCLATVSLLTLAPRIFAHEVDAEPPVSPYSARADCIVSRESNWNPNAVNPRSGAAGLGQFLRSTWMTTPQGKAGLSVFDPWANHAAVCWMLSQGRALEFEVVLRRLC